MEGCIFCRIVAQEVPCEVVYEDGDILAFRDINPLAPVHVLIVPKAHIASLQELSEEHSLLMGRMVLASGEIARAEGIARRGYRIPLNCGPQGGQAVPIPIGTSWAGVGSAERWARARRQEPEARIQKGPRGGLVNITDHQRRPPYP
jgi:histidine triad (HIT) family protein